MFRKKVFGVIVVLLFVTVSGAILSTGCYDDDKARITIHLERNDLAVQKEIKQKNIIDRVLEFFSTPAYAVIGWSSVHGGLTLKVRSSNLGEMSYTIPGGAETYSITMSPEKDVTFEVISYTMDGDVPYNWGGHKTLDVDFGEQDIILKMIPMTQITGVGGSTELNVNWDPPTAYVTTYNIYRANNSSGPYTLVGTRPSGQQTFPDMTTLMGVTYYYRISVVNSNGEGVMCAYSSGSR